MRRKNILVLMISLSLVLLLGSSYAILRSTVVGNNSYVINVGTLEVTFVDSKTEFLNLTNMYPMSDKEGSSQDKELSFVVQNTGNVDSYYDVTLEETSTNPEFKSVIRYIINKDDKGYSEPKTLGEDKFIEAGGYLKPNESSSYKVKVWLDYDADNTYMNKEFKAKVVVNSFQESNYAKDIIKSKLVKYEESSKENFNGGLVAVNANGELYNEADSKQIIREYRYSGSNVDNYVTFNDETWRIIGVFKEGNEEFLKIVRDDILDSSYLPSNFYINDTQYSLQSTLADYPKAVFWYGNSKNQNDWTTAGLQYYLNNEQDNNSNPNYGYLHYLTNDYKNMIRNTIYYLGSVSSDTSVSETPIESYNHEHDSNNILDGNKGSWSGKVGLMYPSDYGYSVNRKNWNELKILNYNTVFSNSWMSTMKSAKEYHTWFITPFSGTTIGASIILNNGIVTFTSIYNSGTSKDGRDVAVRPCLYLKSNVKITSGDGTSDNAYNLGF